MALTKEQQVKYWYWQDKAQFGSELRLFLDYGASGLSITVRLGRYDGDVLCKVRGGNLDLTGVALGEAITCLFPERIRGLIPGVRDGQKVPDGWTGLSEREGRKYVEGAVGRDSMLRLLEALGFSWVSLIETGPRGYLLLCTR